MINSLDSFPCQLFQCSIVINILTSETLNGFIPANKLKLVLAWIEIHKDELIADWSLAVEWKEIFKIYRHNTLEIGPGGYIN